MLKLSALENLLFSNSYKRMRCIYIRGVARTQLNQVFYLVPHIILSALLLKPRTLQHIELE
jgi:hypothetical protein